MSYGHLTIQPVKISLSELPREGRQFVYSSKGAELTPFIGEFVGPNEYKVEIFLKPMGNVYEATGKIETSLDQTCALCAIDLKWPIRERFQEILVVMPHAEGHEARVNHSSELNMDGPNCTELESEHFHIGEFIRELIGIATPIKPTARPDCGVSCDNYQEALKKGWISQSNDEGFAKESPFKVLADLKLKS